MVFAVDHVVGVALATITAAAFAVYYLCVRLGTDRGRVLDVMLVSLLTNVVLIVPLVGIVHGVPTITLQSFLAFVAAGLSGSLLARITLIKSVQTIGASRTSPIAASNVFFASLIAIILFDERLTALHVLGIVLVVAGVAVITWETSHDVDPGASLRERRSALILPIVGAILLGFEPIFITLGLSGGTAVLPGVAIKAVAATVGFVLYLKLRTGLPAELLRWSSHTKWYVGAGLTSTIGIVTFFAALEVAPVVLVVPLVQTSPLLVVVLSALLLPTHLERVTARLVAGALVVVAGAMLVSIFG